MAIQNHPISFVPKYFSLGGQPLPSPLTVGYGSSVAYGQNVFLTASHNFEYVEDSQVYWMTVRVKAANATLDGVAIDSFAHLRGYDANTAYNNLGTANPTNDLAYATAKVDVAVSALSPAVVFADQQTATNFLTGKMITRTGSATPSSTGLFDGSLAPGEFDARTPAQKGDSGGPASPT